MEYQAFIPKIFGAFSFFWLFCSNDIEHFCHNMAELTVQKTACLLVEAKPYIFII